MDAGDGGPDGHVNWAELTIEELCVDARDADCPVSTIGQVVRVRPLSRQLRFLDLRPVPASHGKLDETSLAICRPCAKDALGAELGLADRVTVVCKRTNLSSECMELIRTSVRVGDVVRIAGIAEASKPHALPSICAAQCDIVSRWRDAHAGEHFESQPLGTAALRKLRVKEPDPGAPATEPPLGDSCTEGNGQSQSPLPKPCVRFVSSGQCAIVGCGYAHRVPREGRAAFLRRLARERGERARLRGDPHTGESKAKHAMRAQVFADWLVGTFGPERLRAGTGVVDVAGGRGDLAFELHTLRGVPTTVVDPRPAQLRREQHRFFRDNPKARRWPHMQTRFDLEFCMAPEHAELLGGCSLIVGMHPDEATGAIVECAVELGVPFAVVPCCVFSAQFPERLRPADGLAVTSYEDLVDWLQHTATWEWKRSGREGLAAAVSRAFLPFQGKNQVIFAAPPIDPNG